MKDNKKEPINEAIRLHGLFKMLTGIMLGIQIVPICLVLFRDDTTRINAMIVLGFIICIICSFWVKVSRKKMEIMEEDNRKTKRWHPKPPEYSVDVETSSMKVGYMYNYEQLGNWANETLSETHWKKIQHELIMLRQKHVEITEEEPYIKIIVKRI